MPIFHMRGVLSVLALMRSIAVGLAFGAAVSLSSAPASAATSQIVPNPAGEAAVAFTAIARSVKPVTDVDTGALNRAEMSVEVILAPRNADQLAALAMTLSNPRSASYGRWLAKGQFNARFAPSAAQAAAVAAYLRSSGLVVGQSSSPFFVRASGSSSTVAAAFRTSLRTYRNTKGIGYFSNASAVQLPATLAAHVVGVVGLASTLRLQPRNKLTPTLIRKAELTQSNTASATASCEAPYPTAEQLFSAVDFGIGFPFGYGGGPGCNGLTPAQLNAIYGAPNVGSRGKGAGVNLAVFELSAYQHSDITTWARHYYGPHYTPRLVDLTVDGGPLHPICPAFDICPAEFNGYFEDAEVDLDIETQLSLAPDVSHILVYNAPSDTTGQTSLDEYARIASDDIADVVSSSWMTCEALVTPAYTEAENTIFEQMAVQGQSMFIAAGDTGPFGCIRGGSNVLSDGDPVSPWLTTVGGTSFETFNPGTKDKPSYPSGIETVWNVDNLCGTKPQGGQSGFFWCAVTGAGGGGNSQFWQRPFFQFGPGISNPYSAQCALASVAKPCRETPDVSANADEFTPFAEYCTGTKSLPNSGCANIRSNVPGWFGDGGTSEASPLWSAIIADRDSFQGTRTGSANCLLYLLYNIDPHGYFNDITGVGQSTNYNGLYPTVPGYDLATGIGTPKMSAIITGVRKP